MKRSIQCMLSLTAAAAMTFSTTVPVEACGGARSSSRLGSFRGRGFMTGAPPVLTRSQQKARYGHTSSRYSRPVPTRTVYAQPIAPQPVYTQVPQTYSPAIHSAPRQPVVEARPTTVASPAASAPAMNSVAPRPSRSVAPVQPSVSEAASQLADKPATTPTSAQASALRLLASISKPKAKAETAVPSDVPAIPEFKPASTSTPAHVGIWSVTLPGNQSVQLTLGEDGTFKWTATRQGKSSTFDGQYRLEDGQLTLVRSKDLQQMKGAWKGDGDQFTFTLDGSTTGGLAFKRA